MSHLFSKLLLNQHTVIGIRSFVRHHSHGLMLIGPAGAGKRYVAEHIAAELLGLSGSNELNKYPYYLHLTRPENKQDISINAVRDIIHTARLKVPRPQEVKRLILIEDAQYLSQPAQNAMLKILEEPSGGTLFILTAISLNSVLPTMASRLFRLDVMPVSLAAATGYYKNLYPVDQIKKAWALSQGYCGLMHALLANDQQHPLRQSVDVAKRLIRLPNYELAKDIDEVINDGMQLPLLLDALNRLIAAMHHSALSKNQSKLADSMLKKRQLIKRLKTAVDNNANQRLVILELALNLNR